MDEQPSVTGKAGRVVRRVVRYGGTEPLPLRLAVAAALAARNAGGRLAVGYRDRWCDGQDPSELFLLGVDPGNDLTLETTGPRAGELLDELQQLLESPPAASVRPPSEPEG
jgi:phosphotransferase system HPr-like phosphotransfer protein